MRFRLGFRRFGRAARPPTDAHMTEPRATYHIRAHRTTRARGLEDVTSLRARARLVRCGGAATVHTHAGPRAGRVRFCAPPPAPPTHDPPHATAQETGTGKMNAINMQLQIPWRMAGAAWTVGYLILIDGSPCYLNDAPPRRARAASTHGPRLCQCHVLSHDKLDTPRAPVPDTTRHAREKTPSGARRAARPTARGRAARKFTRNSIQRPYGLRQDTV